MKKILEKIKEFFLAHTSESFRKALKEFARLGLLTGIGILTEGVLSGNVDYKLVIVGSAVAVVKAIDKYIHEQGVLEGNASKTLGLTRF